MAQAENLIPAVSLFSVETNTPTYTEIGTNKKQAVMAFDDTTQQYLSGTLKVHADIDTTGTVTFRVYGRPATAAASKGVVFDLDHWPIANNEAGDTVNWTTENSGKQIPSSVSNNDDIFTWTETVTNLGWTAGDSVKFRLSRDTGDGNDDLVGDYYVYDLGSFSR